MVRRFERMIVPVSGHYVSLEQLNWLRRIVREERRMSGSLSVSVLFCDFRSALCFSAVENAEAGCWQMHHLMDGKAAAGEERVVFVPGPLAGVGEVDEHGEIHRDGWIRQTGL